MAKFDDTQAVSEGWSLFDVDGRLQLQRIDEHEDGFNTDAEAIVHVALMAAQGSEYHWEALGLIGALSENL